jgi:nucleotide-binding universal stress UspA family protein
MKKIIVPVDFSKYSYYALEVAANLAKKIDASLFICHILDLPHMSLSDGDTPASIFMLKMTKDKMKKAMAKPYLEGVKVQEEVVYDETIDFVSEKANEIDADLIIMGTHGSRGDRENFVGSNTEKVVRTADVPVLAIKQKYPEFDPKHIAFASNFYGEVDSVFEKVKNFAKVFDSKIHLLKVVTPNLFETTPYSQKLMDDFAKRFELDNYETHIFNEKHVEDGIIDFSRLNNMDLIAMSTHGRTGLARILNGSIAEEITNHAPLPVLSIKVKETKNSGNILFPDIR